MPRILLSNSTLNGYAGSELVTFDLATEFLGRGYEVTVATFERKGAVAGDLADLGVEWLDLDGGTVTAVKGLFDLIWAHHFTTLDAILADLQIDARAIIFSSMSPFEPLECPPWYASRLSYLLANSEETKHQMLEYGIPADSVHIFPNPVAHEFFATQKTPSSVFPMRMAVVSNHLVPEVEGAIALLQSQGVEVNVIGMGYRHTRLTAELLATFDCVVTIGRTVQQSLVLGSPVYCYDRFGGPGYLTTENFEKASYFNFSGRCCRTKKNPQEIAAELLTGYVLAVQALVILQATARTRYRLDAAVDQVLTQVGAGVLEDSGLVAARRHTQRMRQHKLRMSGGLHFAQLFWDVGDGFSETASELFPLGQADTMVGMLELVFELKNVKDLIALRLDPLNESAVITLHGAELTGPYSSVVVTGVVSTNASDESDGTYFFTNDDPQLIIQGVDFSDATQLKVSLIYEAVGAAALKKCLAQQQLRLVRQPQALQADDRKGRILEEISLAQSGTVAAVQALLKAEFATLSGMQAHFVQLTQARQQIESQILQLAAREKAFSQQLQDMQQTHDQQKAEQSREYAMREQAYLAQLSQARQQIESQLMQLAERETVFSQQLLDMQQAHEKQKFEQSRQQVELERLLYAQLLARQDELHGVTQRSAEAEKAHLAALSELRQELNATRGTYSWRWTAPLRSVAGVFAKKTDAPKSNGCR